MLRPLIVILLACLGAAPVLAAPSLGSDGIPADMPAEVRQFVEQLYSPDARRCVAAAKALGRLGPMAAPAAPYLASMLDGHFSEEIPNQSTAALVRIGKGAFDAVAAATSATGSDARRRSVLALARIDPARAVPLILELLTGELAGDYTIGALRATGQAGFDAAVAWAASSDPARRRAATKALLAYANARMGYHGVHEIAGGERPVRPRPREVVDLLMRLLGDGEPEVRLAAMASLQRISPSREVEVPLGDSLRAALRDPRPSLRLGAIDLIRATGATDKDKFDAIEPLISDSSDDVRSAAAAALVGMPEQRARAIALMLTLLKDSTAEIRAQAALALGRLRAREAEEPLLKALADPSVRVRVWTAIALARCSGKQGIEAVLRLTHSEDPQLRFESTRALAERCLDQAGVAWSGRLNVRMTGAEHAWAPRIGLAPVPGALLASFPDAAVRERLMVLLQGPDKDLHILAAEALITGAGRDVPQSVLLAALASPVKSAWYVALLRLEQNKAVPDRAFLEPLRRVAQTGELYADCLPLLLRMGDTATVLRSCERLLKHEYSKVSCQAVSILAGAGEGAFETLFKHVADRRSDVREAAARALGDQIDHPRVLAFVEGALKSDDSVLRQGAQAVLKTANRGVAPPMARQAQLREAILADREGWRDLHRKVDAAAVQLARDLLRDNEANVRAAVAQMLGEASDDTAVAALKEALIDRSPLVRSQAIVSLGKLGHRSAAASILPLLTDVDPAVCEAAAIALGRLGDPAAVEPLVTVLGNLDWRQRRAAAQALGMLRAPRACQPLRGVLAGDPHWQVRAVAATALGHVGDRSAAAALIAAVDDEHWRVRQAGAEALQSLTGQKFGVDVRAWEAWCRAQPGPATTRKGQ